MHRISRPREIWTGLPAGPIPNWALIGAIRPKRIVRSLPGSTTRLGGMPKKVVTFQAFLERQENNPLRHPDMRPSPLVRRIFRPTYQTLPHPRSLLGFVTYHRASQLPKLRAFRLFST